MKNTLDIPRTAMEVFNLLPEGTRCEVIDNTLYMSPLPTSDHQDLLGDIFFLLKQAVIQNRSGKVFISPLDVYLDNELSVVQPDILFVKTANLHLVQRKGVIGSPDMVIEVLSSNKDYDLGKKFELYEKNRISEYIIINPDTKEVRHYVLTGDKYETLPSKKGVLNSNVISTEIKF